MFESRPVLKIISTNSLSLSVTSSSPVSSRPRWNRKGFKTRTNDESLASLSSEFKAFDDDDCKKTELERKDAHEYDYIMF